MKWRSAGDPRRKRAPFRPRPSGSSTKILSAVFESLEPLKLRVFSAKEKRKVVALTKIVEQFEPGRTYTEKEVNGILRDIFDDYVTLRRYLIEYGFLERTRDCRTYWRR